MRKSLGGKRQEIGEDDVALITRTFGDFAAIESYRLDREPNEKSNRGRQSTSKQKAAKKTFGSKIFAGHEFGYRRSAIEPLLTFKRGALVHFAVSQNEAWLTGRINRDEGQVSKSEKLAAALMSSDLNSLLENFLEVRPG
jgi:hypothetical protein